MRPGSALTGCWLPGPADDHPGAGALPRSAWRWRRSTTGRCCAGPTSAFMSALIGSLYNYLAPQITRSGVMMEIHGEGVLFQERVRRGKAEIAIEADPAGHRTHRR